MSTMLTLIKPGDCEPGVVTLREWADKVGLELVYLNYEVKMNPARSREPGRRMTTMEVVFETEFDAGRFYQQCLNSDWMRVEDYARQRLPGHKKKVAA